jgi:protoheme IX farnesyltransferase
MRAASVSVSEPARFSDYLELTKPRLSLLSVLTALAGYLAARPAHDTVRLVCVIVGTSLAAGGVAALNQWLEFDTDAQMQRTSQRPSPSGKIATGSAFVLGSMLCLAALMLVFAKVGALAALFTLLTVVTYLGWYTPAKRWSRWSTEIGAIAGALPPLIGWAAAEGTVTALGWILFGFLYFWQMPHFMAIAWIYRKDYSAVHFPMPTVTDETGRWPARWSFINTLLLFCVSLLPWYLGLDTRWYGIVALTAGLWFLWRAMVFLRPGDRDVSARKLFFASIAYLPLTLGALVADRMLFFPTP